MTARNDAIIVFPVISLRLLSNTPQRNQFFCERLGARPSMLSYQRRFAYIAIRRIGAHQRSSFPDVELHIVDAPLGASRESILTIVVMDSGLARFTRARNDDA
jgi:hypothetical protein